MLLFLFIGCETTPCDEPDAGIGVAPATHVSFSVACTILGESDAESLNDCSTLELEVALEDGTVLSYAGEDQIAVSFMPAKRQNDDDGNKVALTLGGIAADQTLADGYSPRVSVDIPHDFYVVGEVEMADGLSETGGEECQIFSDCPVLSLSAYDPAENQYIYDLGGTFGGVVTVGAAGLESGDAFVISADKFPMTYEGAWWDAAACDDGLIHYRQ